jgi:uncharacterized protein YsxB (DUF464 family)
MIKVVIKKDTKGSITGFEIKGHSGYAEEGQDIICSAVSVTAYTAAGALDELAGLRRCYSESDGHMTIKLPRQMTELQESTAAIIMKTTAVGFKQIELSYGKYVLVVEEEV